MIRNFRAPERHSGRRVHPLTGEASVTLDPLEMLARLHGTDANRTRGARARRLAGAGKKPASPRSEADTPAPTQRERRQQWARLIAKVFEPEDPAAPAAASTVGRAAG